MQALWCSGQKSSPVELFWQGVQWCGSPVHGIISLDDGDDGDEEHVFLGTKEHEEGKQVDKASP